jgi:hypothetical protein
MMCNRLVWVWEKVTRITLLSWRGWVKPWYSSGRAICIRAETTTGSIREAHHDVLRTSSSHDTIQPTNVDVLRTSSSHDTIQPTNVLRIKVHTAVTMSVVVLPAVTRCMLVTGYQRFGGTYRFHLHGEVKMVAIRSSEALVSTYETILRHTRKTTTDE